MVLGSVPLATKKRAFLKQTEAHIKELQHYHGLFTLDADVYYLCSNMTSRETKPDISLINPPVKVLYFSLVKATLSTFSLAIFLALHTTFNLPRILQ